MFLVCLHLLWPLIIDKCDCRLLFQKELKDYHHYCVLRKNVIYPMFKIVSNLGHNPVNVCHVPLVAVVASTASTGNKW